MPSAYETRSHNQTRSHNRLSFQVTSRNVAVLKRVNLGLAGEHFGTQPLGCLWMSHVIQHVDDPHPDPQQQLVVFTVLETGKKAVLASVVDLISNREFATYWTMLPVRMKRFASAFRHHTQGFCGPFYGAQPARRCCRGRGPPAPGRLSTRQPRGRVVRPARAGRQPAAPPHDPT